MSRYLIIGVMFALSDLTILFYSYSDGLSYLFVDAIASDDVAFVDVFVDGVCIFIYELLFSLSYFWID